MTAIEWLLDQLENQVSDDGKQTMSLKVTGFLREQAKEMEKQQQGYSAKDMINFVEFVSQYYADDSMENSSIKELLEQFKNK